MNLFKHFKDQTTAVLDRLVQDGKLPVGLNLDRISFEPPRDAAHGDMATNAAMVLCKDAKMKPRDLAGLLAPELEKLEHVAAVEVAGPGFINIRLDDSFWQDRLKDVLEAGVSYGYSDAGAGAKVNVEYVSANPTGPMHVGHARGAVFGDVLASLREKTGFDVTREYYLNDAGAQVQSLARSVYHRYRQALGVISEADYNALKEAGEVEYGGEYLKPTAALIKERHGGKWLDADEADWLPYFRDFAVTEMVELIKQDLAVLGVEHAIFTSELHDLINANKVDEAFAHLQEMGLIYEGVLEPPKGKVVEDWEARPQTLFRATEFGDEVDRPLKKSNGEWTYFASDIAYHWDKFRRGYHSMIDVWGADHGGYVKRVQASVKAVTDGQGTLDVKLCNMVKLLDQGVPVKMSKRSGNFVTLREVVDRVGKDVVRFIMLTRRNDQNLDFDLTKVTEQSRDNPVFYVQYAHARCHSVLRQGSESLGKGIISQVDFTLAQMDRLTDPAEIALIKVMAGWPRLIEGAAQAHEPHRLAYYLNDLAAAFHGLWNKGNEDAELRFLVDDKDLTMARLALVRGVANVISSGLIIFGVEPKEEMR